MVPKSIKRENCCVNLSQQVTFFTSDTMYASWLTGRQDLGKPTRWLVGMVFTMTSHSMISPKKVTRESFHVLQKNSLGIKLCFHLAELIDGVVIIAVFNFKRRNLCSDDSNLSSISNEIPRSRLLYIMGLRQPFRESSLVRIPRWRSNSLGPNYRYDRPHPLCFPFFDRPSNLCSTHVAGKYFTEGKHVLKDRMISVLVCDI